MKKHAMTELGIKNCIASRSIELAKYTAVRASAPENVIKVLGILQNPFPFVFLTGEEKNQAHDQVLEATGWCRELSATDRSNLWLQHLTLTMEYALTLVTFTSESNPFEVGYGLDACDKALEVIEGWRHY